MKQKQPVKLQKETLERRSANVWKFIKIHPEISIRKIINKEGYDPSNFHKYKKAKKRLPQHLLLKIEKVLIRYGLVV